MKSDLEVKIDRLADIEAIKTLKYRYAAYCDDDYDADGVASLFVEDALWDGGSFGTYKGRDAIRAFFAGLPDQMEWSTHYLLNPIIEVDGDTATGAWLLWQPLVLREDSQAMWVCARYEDKYARIGDTWFFKSVKVDIQAFSPYEEGFGKERFPSPEA